jgi:hypothetical protein
MECHALKICLVEFGDILKNVQKELKLSSPITVSVCMDGDVQQHNLLDENKEQGGWVSGRVDDLNHCAKNIYKKIIAGLKGLLMSE